MKILHVTGRELREGNGIAAAIPPLVSSQNRRSGTEAALLFNVPGLSGRADAYDFPSFYLSSLGDVDRLLAETFVPDLAVFHEVYYAPFLRLSKRLRAREIPYLIVPHNSLTDAAQRQKKHAKRLLNALFFRGFVANAAGIAFLNEAEEAASASFRWNASIIVGNGVTPPRDGDALLQIKPDAPLRIVFLSRIDYVNKGLDVLLQAAGLLNRAFFESENVELLLYGDGPAGHVERVRREASALANPRVKYAGPVYGADKVAALAAGHLFVLPSRFEGLPIAPLEALSYGLPCILTPETNLGDVVSASGTGWVSPGDPDRLAETIAAAVREYRADPKGYGRRAQALIRARYTWDDVGERSVEAYRELLRK